MPVDTVLVSALGPDKRAACLAEGRLVRFVLTPPEGAVGGGPRAGDVYLGRVTRVDRGLAAAFVDIGAARPGFLGFADAFDPRRPPAEGEAVVVRVLRAADDGKGARLAARPLPPPDLLARAKSARPPLRLEAAVEPISAAIAAAAAATGSALARVIVDDAETLVTLRQSLPALAPLFRHHTGKAPVFAADAVDAQLAAALAPWQPLADGGALAIRETPAAVTVDVDLGGASGGSAAVLATNLQAMAAIAEAIVFGDLAGHIVIDPIAVRDRRQRGTMLARLREAVAEAETMLGADRRIIRFGGFTPLGLIELVRERRAPSLRRQLGVTADGSEKEHRAPWVAAGDALRAVVAEAAVHPGRVPRLLVDEAVGEALTGVMAPARSAAEVLAGGPIEVTAAASTPAQAWRLIGTRAR